LSADPFAVTPRKRFSVKERLALFQKAGGKCCLCGGKIDAAREKWIVEHVRPLWCDGDNSADNVAPAHAKCAAEKTTKEARERGKVRRSALRHMGVKTRKGKPMPGGRDSQWKRLMNGTVVKR
jgi:5-methylcytosine-specific restriction endonuclease McrA